MFESIFDVVKAPDQRPHQQTEQLVLEPTVRGGGRQKRMSDFAFKNQETRHEVNHGELNVVAEEGTAGTDHGQASKDDDPDGNKTPLVDNEASQAPTIRAAKISATFAP